MPRARPRPAAAAATARALRVPAMSMEAKASAAIIGSLPIIVGMLVYASSPQDIELLWTTIHGRIWMAIGGFLMLCGVLVMRKMISFDI